MALVTSNDRVSRILVVEEDEVMRVRLCALLTEQPWVASCSGAESASAAQESAFRDLPDLVLISTSLEGRSGVDLCSELSRRLRDVHVVLMFGDTPVLPALAVKYGAAASLPKQLSAAAFVAAVRHVAGGALVFPENSSDSVRLSNRELDVLRCIALGLSNPEVAALLHLSPWTIKQYASAVYRKLGVRNRTQAVGRARDFGLITT